jgi:hypothetical protein
MDINEAIDIRAEAERKIQQILVNLVEITKLPIIEVKIERFKYGMPCDVNIVIKL